MFVFRDAGRGGGVRVCDRDNFKFNKISPIYVNNRVKEGKPYKSIYILPSQYTGEKYISKEKCQCKNKKNKTIYIGCLQ